MTVCNKFHTLTELVATQAAAAPSRLAVCDGDLTLDYAGLEARANRLARHLAGHGAGRESLVAILLPRSADLIIATLAALKAGAGYAPIDPMAPTERIAAMLDRWEGEEISR